MKALKRGWVLPLAALWLLLCVAGASAGAMVQADYESIVADYRAALAADSPQEALERLESLRDYYEAPGRAQALEAYDGNALLFYTYAKGIIAFEQQDYYSAWEEFQLLQGAQVTAPLADVPPLPDTTYYYQFSMAMLYEAYGDFASAFEALETARTAVGASAKACKDAKEQFGEAMKTEAQACCDRGDHEQAQSYYQLYADNVNIFQGQALIRQCQQHSQVTPLSMGTVAAAGPNAIALSWVGGAGAYRVSWSADLTGKAAPESKVVQGNATELTGLLPGTAYRVTVTQESNGANVSATVSTQTAPTYRTNANGGWKVGRSILRRYDRSFYSKAANLFTLYDYIMRRSSSPMESSVTLARINDEGCGYVYMVETNQSAAALYNLKGSAYTVQLHLTGLGTVVSQGQICDTHSDLYENVIAFTLDPALDEALALYSLEGDTPYTVELLTNGELLVSVSGKIVAGE